jgi:hypothetical protein
MTRPDLIPLSDPVNGLEVSRDDLSKAVNIVAGMARKWSKGVSLRFSDGWLFIEAGHSRGIARAPARGCWPVTIIVGISWVRRLAKSMPAGDPIRLRVEDGMLHANRYSQPCSLSSNESPFSPEAPGSDEAAVISEAAKILKPLYIRRKDIQGLVLYTRVEGTSKWSLNDRKMISIIAKAWALLGPLGIETADIRELADDAVRNGLR